MMVLVALAAIVSALVAARVRQVRLSRIVTVRVVNRRSTPLTGIRVAYPGGVQTLPRIAPGAEGQWRFETDTDATVRVIDGDRSVAFGKVRGGSRPTVTFGD
jgi:hypothetical protein